jgi:hypothetical protein
MRILFDQGSPVPLRSLQVNHVIETVFELGWSELKNNELLAAAEGTFDLLITTDQQLRYQQNLAERKLSILVLMTTSWPRIKIHVQEIELAVEQMSVGEYREISLK